MTRLWLVVVAACLTACVPVRVKELARECAAWHQRPLCTHEMQGTEFCPDQDMQKVRAECLQWAWDEYRGTWSHE